MRNINKECIINENDIIIRLEDPRDNYIYKNALGEIGKIYISREGIMISANYDSEQKIELLRNKKLTEAFTEIFEATDYNPLSRKYYDKILIMVEDGTLEFLGYEIKREEELTELGDLFLHNNQSLSDLHLPNLREENVGSSKKHRK